MGDRFGCSDRICIDWNQRRVDDEFCHVCVVAFVAAVATVVSILACTCVDFSCGSSFIVRIKPHFDCRTHLRSQLQICGPCWSFTGTPSAPARDSRATIEP